MQRELWFTHSGYEYNVRSWPVADIGCCAAHVRFQG
jgi:hypothetical protein